MDNLYKENRQSVEINPLRNVSSLYPARHLRRRPGRDLPDSANRLYRHRPVNETALVEFDGISWYFTKGDQSPGKEFKIQPWALILEEIVRIKDKGHLEELDRQLIITYSIMLRGIAEKLAHSNFSTITIGEDVVKLDLMGKTPVLSIKNAEEYKRIFSNISASNRDIYNFILVSLSKIVVPQIRSFREGTPTSILSYTIYNLLFSILFESRCKSSQDVFFGSKYRNTTKSFPHLRSSYSHNDGINILLYPMGEYYTVNHHIFDFS